MLLTITNLHAGYGETEILHGVSLAIDRGEAVALIGPNGTGKSTILKSIMGLTTIRDGAIMWDGKDTTHTATHQLLSRGIGFVPQGRLVFPSLTVQENLNMGGYTIPNRARHRERMDTVLELFPALREKLTMRAGSLSGGQQQMLAIARALMTEPRLLMLDEPSLGLSPKITHEVFETLRRIHATGTALLIVEQNVRLVLQQVTRGYLLTNGSIACTGSATELANDELMHAAYLM